MERPLTDALEHTGLKRRSRWVLAAAPGCLFGFPPPHLDRMFERADCPHCQVILKMAERIAALRTELAPKIAEFRRPYEERNHAAGRSWRRRIPIIGKLIGPRPEPVPNHQDEPWYAEMKRLSRGIIDLAEAAREEDPGHWGDAEEREISNSMVSALLNKGGVISDG